MCEQRAKERTHLRTHACTMRALTTHACNAFVVYVVSAAASPGTELLNSAGRRNKQVSIPRLTLCTTSALRSGPALIGCCLFDCFRILCCVFQEPIVFGFVHTHDSNAQSEAHVRRCMQTGSKLNMIDAVPGLFVSLCFSCVFVFVTLFFVCWCLLRACLFVF